MGAKFLSLLAVYFVLFCQTAFAQVPGKTKVLIIGAGISGLVTGYELKKLEKDFHILEASPHVGGRVRTMQYGFHQLPIYANYGMEEYWESNPIVPLLRELGLPLNESGAVSSFVFKQRIYAYVPGESKEAFLRRVFSPKDYEALQAFDQTLRTLSEKPVSKQILELRHLSFAGWVAKQNLSRKVREWIRITLEPEIGTRWTQISAIDGIAEFKIFLGSGEKSFQVVGGNERFTEKLVQALGSEHISANQQVTRIVRGPQSTKVYFYDRSTGEASVVEADHVVSTIPVHMLSELQIEPSLSKDKRRAISRLEWGSYIKAHVFVKRSADRYFTKNGHSILPLLTDGKLGTIYGQSPDQKTDLTVLTLLISGPTARDFASLSSNGLRKKVFRELDALWPGITAEVESVEFFKDPSRSIAAWPVGRSRFDSLSDSLRTPENGIYISGDFTESSHSDGAIRSAYRTVKAILAVEDCAEVLLKSQKK